MNRADRRKEQKQGKLVKKDPVLNYKESDIQRIKEEAAAQAYSTAFLLMLSIPVMVLHNNYPKLMRREVDGESREERFADMCMEMYEQFDQGHITLEDLREDLLIETGIKLGELKRR